MNPQKMLSIMLAVIMLLSIFSVPASAATPETVEPMASDYLSTYSGWMSRESGSKEMSVNFSVVGTDIMDLIGVRLISVYYSSDGENWTIHGIYRYEDYPHLMKSDTAVCSASLAVTGSYGYYYKAYLVFKSELDGGYDERAIYTSPIYVSRFS